MTTESECQAQFETACRHMGKFGTVVCEQHPSLSSGGDNIWTVEVRDYSITPPGVSPNNVDERVSKMLACGTHYSMHKAGTECMVNLLKKLGEAKERK